MESIRAELFGRNPKVLKTLKFVENVAVTRVPVLILGELGTGKEKLAKYIHELSNRKEEKFLVVDCSQESQTVENEILGYRDDASGRFVKGVLEFGNGGSIALLNIDSVSESFQKRLHQVLTELSDYDIDIRIIATTTKNLSKLVGAGKFHRGLYAYISGSQVSMVSLRERPEDIQFLSEEILKVICEKENCPIPIVDGEVNKKLLAHYWTHNISELFSVMKESFENSDKKEITLNDLALGDRKVIHSMGGGIDDGVKLMSLKEAEKLLIKKALIHTSENRTQAAKILGVSIRTLRNKINEYRVQGSQFFLNLR
ncbi:MAG: sigma 54-interacting transcriptional regulator [Bacteriovoracales bacterium]|nr:sigma 54-interacting transcriptional regulator [Bacteriovoracales bacterium]